MIFTKNTNKKSVFFSKKYGFLILILNINQHGQNTEFFSVRYGLTFIDLTHLDSNPDPYLLNFAKCLKEGKDPRLSCN